MIKILTNLFPLLLKYALVTVLVEEGCLIIQRPKSHITYILCLIMNVITNMTMNVVLQLFSENYYLYLIIFEMLVVVVEGLLYHIFEKDINKSFRISLICNIGSFVFGMLF